MIFLWNKLKEKGVLGINKRNADFILPYNKRKYYPLVDDKLRTKNIALKKGITVPELYGVIEIHRQIRELEKILKNINDFVIKPVHGSGGKGILVIIDNIKNKFKKTDGRLIALEEIKHHISNILTGIYSLSGQPDKAIIEYRVKPDKIFDKISYRGVPDIRTIVFRGMPVMSMLRLPTSMSDGKANLHQGAIGAGINISKGITTWGVVGNEIIGEHPDTGCAISGITIPEWERCIEIAAECHGFSGLDYIGVDIVIDQNHGPMVLELNARPGLNIQIANKQGLLKRLSLIKSLDPIPTDISKRIKIVKQYFSTE